MAKYYDSCQIGELRNMMTILIDHNAMEKSRFHFAFCFEESGSMSGAPWQALMQAYAVFINEWRNYQGMGDVVSTIAFSCTYRRHGTLVPINKLNTGIKSIL